MVISFLLIILQLLQNATQMVTIKDNLCDIFVDEVDCSNNEMNEISKKSRNVENIKILTIC